MGLDESFYGDVKFNLLSRDPLPTLDEAYNVLTQDEESKLAGRLHEKRIDGLSFAVQTSSYIVTTTWFLGNQSKYFYSLYILWKTRSPCRKLFSQKWFSTLVWRQE